METISPITISCPICKGKYNSKCKFCKNKGECHYIYPSGYHDLMAAVEKYKAQQLAEKGYD